MFDGRSDRVSIRSEDDDGDSDGDGMSSREEKEGICDEKEDEDVAKCLVMLSNSRGKSVIINNNNNNHHHHHQRKTAQVGGNFECKACKKVFKSHQALGGHRASHKKVKGCFASAKGSLIEEDEDHEYGYDDDDEEEDQEKSTAQISRKRSNGHECTICHRVFASGQALGGHKRCHWLTPTSAGNHHHHHHQPSFYVEDNSDKPVVGKCEPLDRPSLDLNLGYPESSINSTARNEEKNNNRFKQLNGEAMIGSSHSSWLQLASGHWS